MFLDENIFKTIINSTPLISFDLIVSKDDKYLLGKRKNNPAKDFWFVPGGRIYKGETLIDGFARVTYSELGSTFIYNPSDFMGVYEHFYPNNFFNDEFPTHYIVLAQKINTYQKHLTFNYEQHDDFLWLTKSEIIQMKNAHANTKAYFL